MAVQDHTTPEQVPPARLSLIGVGSAQHFWRAMREQRVRHHHFARALAWRRWVATLRADDPDRPLAPDRG